MKKSAFLTFCFSFIPGAGQMYQGYMKRGCSIMILFAIFCALTGVVASPIFSIPLPIIFAYSFFDTFNIRNKVQDGNQKDEYIWENWDFGDKFESFKGTNKVKIVGWILIIFGVYLVLNTVLRQLAFQYNLNYLYNIINIVLRYLSTIIVAAIAIGVGVKFLSKQK